MKRLLQLALALTIAAAPATMTAKNEDGTYTAKEMKRFEKNAEKQAKSTAKRFKKEGWVLNGTGDVEMKVANHLLRTTEFGGKGLEVVGNGLESKALMQSTTSARIDAANKYASTCGMVLKARIEGEGSIMSDVDAMTFINAFEARVAQEIKGELRPSFELYRKAKSGKYESMVLYIIDEEGAQKAQLRAIQAEAERAKLTQEVARRISEFVNE